MKIIILANRDLASNYALNLLLPALKQHEVTLFLSSTIGGSAKKPAQLESLTLVEKSLHEQMSQPKLNTDIDKNSFKSFEQLSRYLFQDVEELNNINSAPALDKIRQLTPELIISIRYGKILKNEILDIPQHGVLNLHSGILPNYRGVMATFWAMLNNESEIGTTLHYIDDSTIDTGAIISQSHLTIQKEKSYLWHVLQLYISGSELITDAISLIEKGQTIETITQSGSGQYFSFPKESDLVQFNKQGLSLVNEVELIDLIRGPYFAVEN